MMQEHFSQFEDRIQHLIEGGFARLFSGRLHPRELAIQLTKVVEDHASRTNDGQLIAPDSYNIRLHPQDHAAILEAHPDIATRLAVELIEIAKIAGVSLLTSPQVKLLGDKTVLPHQVGIDAWHTAASADATQSMQPNTILEPLPVATLILNGTQHIPINRPIINLGRQRDNHVIINDPTVSRHHAQIRLRFGQYVLFDLGSVGGTTVNGGRIQEAILQSGDVITVGNSNLIFYVEDNNCGTSTDRLLPTKNEC